ncbi:MAG: hypothetical protein E7626_01360 [Ruminococcaceae bacterium]|nr:hypothetical protein [Oscillospiraceae bacterium]
MKKLFSFSSKFENVKWCVYYDSFRKERPEVRMRDHILYLQRELSLDEKYRITKDEFPIIADILKCFQQDLIQKYFNGSLPSYKYTDEICFVINLNAFLDKNECEKDFNGNEMYTTKNYKEYGTYGMTSFSATYELTDYAVTYHKLYYITQLYYLKLYNIVDKDKLGVRCAEIIKEAIDNRELEVSRI